MANGLTFVILNIILRMFTAVRILIENDICKEIGSKLREKSPKIMRSWLSIFKGGFICGANSHRGSYKMCDAIHKEKMGYRILNF